MDRFYSSLKGMCSEVKQGGTRGETALVLALKQRAFTSYNDVVPGEEISFTPQDTCNYWPGVQGVLQHYCLLSSNLNPGVSFSPPTNKYYFRLCRVHCSRVITYHTEKSQAVIVLDFVLILTQFQSCSFDLAHTRNNKRCFL